jgi:O-antigen ligase
MIPWSGVVNLPGIGTATKFVGLVVAGVWVVTVIIRGQFRKPAPFHIAVYLFLLWNMVSTFWSADVSRTIPQLITWVQLFGLVFIIWDLYSTRAAILAGLQAYVLGAYVAVGSAFADFLTGNYLDIYSQRYTSAETQSPVDYGIILALGIPMAWYLTFSLGNTKIEKFLKLVNYFYIPIALWGITLSGTRVALIVAIIGMAYGLASLSNIRLSARVTILLLFVLFVILVLPFFQTLPSFQRFGTIVSEITEGDLNNRTVIWREGVDIFIEHPIFGVGSKAFKSVNSMGKVAHNSFLSVLVEVGLIGFGLFSIILAIAVIQAWRQPKWDSIFWLTMLAAWTTGAFVNTWEYRKSTWLILSLIIASSALTSHRDQAKPLVQHEKPEAPVKPYTEKMPSN